MNTARFHCQTVLSTNPLGWPSLLYFLRVPLRLLCFCKTQLNSPRGISRSNSRILKKQDWLSSTRRSSRGRCEPPSRSRSVVPPRSSHTGKRWMQFAHEWSVKKNNLRAESGRFHSGRGYPRPRSFRSQKSGLDPPVTGAALLVAGKLLEKCAFSLPRSNRLRLTGWSAPVSGRQLHRAKSSAFPRGTVT